MPRTITLATSIILVGSILVGCFGPAATPISVTATAPPVALPTLTPVPQSVLDRSAIWVAADGPGTGIVELHNDGEFNVVSLPLNEGQSATNLTVSPDGEYLSYLVVDDDGGAQRGIASWTLTEPNARLIVQPLPGYRVISLMFADDGKMLLYVQTNATADSEAAQWRLEAVPSEGGQSQLLADQASAPGITWPLPIAWPENGPIYLHAAVAKGDPAAYGISSGVFTLDPATGTIALISPPADPIVLDAQISPSGKQLAYTPGTPDGSSSIVKVMPVGGGDAITITPPNGSQAISAVWLNDERYVLLDFWASPDHRETQTWAKVELGRASGWPQNAPDPARADLFTYVPYKDGIVYTLLGAEDAAWIVYLLTEISADVTPFSLAVERVGEGAPRIVWAH